MIGLSLFLLLGAAPVGMPILPNVSAEAVKPDFQPVFNEGGAAAIEVRLTISPDGRLIRCERGFVNGPPQNVDSFCSMLERVQYRPGRDSSGSAVYSRAYVWSHWSNRRWIGYASPQWSPGDLSLTLNKLPKGFAEDSKVSLALEVDSKGVVGKCAVLVSPKAPLAQDVVNLFCREAGAQPVAPTTDQAGNAVPSVQQFIIRVASQKAVDRLEKRFRSDVAHSR
ncbi:MAG: hypothetical protein ACTHKE_09460 [Sphingomicrobium sp.]